MTDTVAAELWSLSLYVQGAAGVSDGRTNQDR